MKGDKNISKSVIARLPRYYRYLSLMLDEGIEKVSSSDLAGKMGLTASQIRQDLNCFDGFGMQGYGYKVEQLRDSIGEIIGIDKKYPCILVGAGNIGKAIASHMNFSSLGFNLVGVFDTDPRLLGESIGEFRVQKFEDAVAFCNKNKPSTAILCVPDNAVKHTVDVLVGCGITSFWNFSHYNISAEHPELIVENVHFNDSLMRLCYNITNSNEQ